MTSSSGVCADNLAELERLLSGRANDDTRGSRHEWWCLWRVLGHSKMRFKVKFPAKIVKMDPPDFVIWHGRHKNEVEITKATFQRYEQVLSIWAKAGEGLLELDPSLFSNRRLKTKDGREAYRQYVRRRGEKLIQDGAVGNQPEQSLAEAIKSALAKKGAANREARGGAKFWLFVDASDHYPGVHVRKVCELIREKLQQSLQAFELVAIDFGGQEIRVWDRASSAPPADIVRKQTNGD